MIDFPSPNFNERRAPLELVILHYTGMQTRAEALARLTQSGSEVSSHYLIDEGGQVFALVAEQNRAWHAGAAAWQKKQDINSRSIGIELSNPGHEFGYVDFPAAQIEALIDLLGGIAERHAIHKHGYLAHSDIAPHRKQDPGERFPWAVLADAGFGLWCEPPQKQPGRDAEMAGISQHQSARNLQSRLAKLGFALAADGVFGTKTQSVVQAFQRHWLADELGGKVSQRFQDHVDALLKLTRYSLE